eukprot:scaffold72513_cov20-Tisochrysis_lutea.AAC.4
MHTHTYTQTHTCAGRGTRGGGGGGGAPNGGIPPTPKGPGGAWEDLGGLRCSGGMGPLAPPCKQYNIHTSYNIHATFTFHTTIKRQVSMYLYHGRLQVQQGHGTP